MFRNSLLWTASKIALFLLLVLGASGLPAITYHIGTTGTNTATDEYYENLQTLRDAHSTLNNDTIILYGDDDSLDVNGMAFIVNGTVDFKSSDGGERVISAAVNTRLFELRGATLNIESGFVFENFTSTTGFIYLASGNSILNAEGVTYLNNTVTGLIGASVFDSETVAGSPVWFNAAGSVFEGNKATNGAEGTVAELAHAQGGDFRSAEIINNTRNTLEGSAIVVRVNEGITTTFDLGTIAGKDSVFRGNEYVDSNGKIVEGSGRSFHITGKGTVYVNIDTDVDETGRGTLYMFDPIHLEGDFTTDITKTGQGTWELHGDTQIQTGSAGQATIRIQEGLLSLYSGAEIHMTGDNDSFTVNAGAILEVTGRNVLEGTTVTFDNDAIISFQMDAFFQGNPRSQELLYLHGDTLKVDGTLVQIEFPDGLGQQAMKGDYMLIRGASEFTANTFTLAVNGERVTNKRFGYTLDQTFGNTLDRETLVLHVDEMRNTVLVWNNHAGNNQWNSSDANFYDDYVYDDNDSFITNDSVVFDMSGTHVITLTGEMIISKDNNFGTGERGMRVSGNGDWTFNGGAISDNYDTVSNMMTGPGFLGALVFDGSGTLTLNNNAANTYHDGTYISGGGTIIARRVDSLGSSEFAGSATTGRRVQNEGYGILFSSSRGGTIRFQNGTTFDPETGLPISGVLDQRISVAANSTGTIELGGAGQRLVVTTDPVYQSYAADKRGGAVNIGQGGSFTTTGNIIFLQNEVNTHGGAIYGADRSKITTDNVQFVLNKAGQRGDGGAIYGGQQSGITLNASRFYNNTAGNDGGAVYAGARSEVKVTNSLFDANTATQGGAVYLGSRTATVETSSFTDNTATRGGAIYVADQAELTADASTFTGNKATDSGGAIYAAEQAELMVAASTFTTNEANLGGAIYAADRAEVTVAALTFTDNEAVISGGAIYADRRAGVTVDGSSFLGNRAANSGGAIYHAGNSGILSAQNAVFGTDSTATNTAGEGGAIYVDNGQSMKLDATGALFVFNAATTGSGGALYVGGTGMSGTYVTLDGASFNANTAKTSGGSVYLADFVLNGNKENRTHGLSAIGTTFTNNTAETGDGGAIRAGANAFLDLSGTESKPTDFSDNLAGNSGGAIAVGTAGAIIADNVNFFGNEAGQKGGAIYSKGAGDYFLRSTTFQENSATTSGGAIYIERSSGSEGYYLNLTDTIFDANKAETGHGGAIYAAQQNEVSFITAAGVTFENNSAMGSGGAVWVEGGTDTDKLVTLNFFEDSTDESTGNSTFKENVAGVSGGAIHTGDFVNLTATNATFESNSATQYGGAIRVGNNSTLEISSAKFTDNAVGGTGSAGGAIYAGSGMKLTIDSAGFRSNTATGSGGAIYAADNARISALVSGGALFESNTAGTTGGAISVNDRAIIELTSGKFTSNTAGTDGGAIATGTGATITMAGPSANNRIEFSKNIAGGDGGAVRATDGAKLDAKNASFSLNEAKGSGGAVSLGNMTSLSLSNAVFSQNSAGNSGGAVSVDSGNVTITGGNLSGNTAKKTGGAVWIGAGTDLTITDSKFSSNKAGQSGGAIHSAGTATDRNSLILLPTSLQGTTFQGNVATDGDGGAIYATYTGLPGSQRSEFVSNKAAGYGGAIYAGTGTDTSDFDVTGSVFKSNSAGADGGALYFAENVNLSVDDDAATFEKNTARSGGAIYAKAGGTLELGGSEFTSNRANEGSGGAILLEASVTGSAISGSGVSFTDNRALAGSGGAIYAVNTDLDFTAATFYDNTASQKGGAILYETTGGNRTVDFKVGIGEASAFSGNRAGSKASSIHFVGKGSTTTIKMTIDTAEEGIFGLYDALVVDAVDNAVKLNITKTGAGTWRLGDVHDLRGTAAGSTVEIEGVLDLQRGAGLLLTNTDERDSFVMKPETGLIVRTGNEISATKMTVTDEIHFDLDGIAADSTSVALTLTGSVETVSGNAIGAGTVNVVDFLEQSGFYNLVQARNGSLAATGILQYKGVNVENHERLKDYWSLSVDDKNSILKLELRPWEHVEMTWAPDPETGNNLWNMEDRNWSGWSEDRPVNQFVDGDTVVFDGNAPGIVLVSPNDVRVDSMRVESDESYEFQGGTITGNTFEKTWTGSLTMSTRFEFDTFDVYGGTLLGGLGSDWVLVGRTGPAHLHLHDGSVFRPTDKFRVDGNITMHGGSSAQWELGATQSLSSAVAASGTVNFDLSDGNVMIFIDNNGLSSGQYGADAPILMADAGLTIDGQAIEEGVYGVNRRVVLIAGENGMLALHSDRSLALQAAVIDGNSTEISLIAFGTGFGAQGPTSDDFNVNQLAVYTALENAPYQSLANEFFGELAKLDTVEQKAEALDGMVTTIGNAAMLVAERSIVRVGSTIFERVHLLNEMHSRGQGQGQAGQNTRGQSPYDRGSNFSPWFTNLGDFQDQNDSRRARGFHSKMYGFMVGVDRSYSQEIVVGLGLSGTFASVDAGCFQSARADTYMASIYGAYTYDDWTLTGNAGYASSEYSFKRRIFTVDSEIKQRGDSFVWGVEFSKKLRNGNTDIRPYGSLQFVSIDVGSHVDRSLGLLGNVKTDSGRSHSALQNLGVKFGNEFTGPLGAVWMPSFTAAWLHDYGKGNLRSKTTFGDGPAFTIIGAERARDRILLGLGSHIAYQHLTFFGSFDSEFSGRMSSQTLQLGFNFVF